MSVQPTIARARTGGVVLTFPFDRWLVDELKTQIPGHARTYDPVAKSWTVAPAYAGIAIRLMYQAFTDVEMVDAAAGPTFDRGGDPREAALIVLHLRETAPPELVTAAHRCLAKLNHPDRGGSTATMQAINAAAEQIRGAR
jgi:hypothetical protein